MSNSLGKRIWALVLAACLLLGMVPVHMAVEAEAVSGVDSLTCSGFISNSTARNYIDTMMRYYINNYSELSGALDGGYSVVFMFEGGSDNYTVNGSVYDDVAYDIRNQAVCIVVQKNSSGNAEIVFYTEDCTSIPDDANWTSGGAYDNCTTVLDGMYKMYTCNHNGSYAAFNTDATWGWYSPYDDGNGWGNYANGINIHTRGDYYAGGQTAGYAQSAGCQLIGYGANSSNAFNSFMKAVAGITWDSYSTTRNTFSSTGAYKGYYVLDRQLGLIDPNGTEYGSGSLRTLYSQYDLTNITEFSTTARANADFSTDYASTCTFYPAYCQFKTTKSTPVNTQPCSITNTTAGSETIETAASGTTWTAIGMYKNTGGNLWYKVKSTSGQIGYIYSGATTYVKQLTSDITLTGATSPNGHVAGNVFAVNGTVASTYNQLNTAAVWIHSGFGTAGTKVTGGSDTVTGNSYSLVNSTIDYATAFNEVSTGKYTYAISANYTNYYASDSKTLGTNTGTVYLMTEYFVVIPSSVSQSTCTHTYSTTTVKAATCTASGTAIKSCSTCGLVSKETVAATGHSYGSWTTVTEATCTTDGTQTRTCSACKATETRTVEASGHNYIAKTYATTCKEYGRTEYTCEHCADSYTVYADELMSEWQETKPEGVDESLIETKEQYRYADKETTTSTQSSLAGYEQVSSAWSTTGTSGSIQYVKSWPTGFLTTNSLYTTYNKTPKTAGETSTTKTVVNSDSLTGYLYYHWCGTVDAYSTAEKETNHPTFHAFYSTTAPSNYTCDTSDNSYKVTDQTTCSQCSWYFYTEVYTQKYTTYDMIYTYEKWGDWSEWSDTPVEATDTRKVETRTLYRYVNAELADHTYVDGVCTVCGAGCEHTWTEGVCDICGLACTHKWYDHECSICHIPCEHEWSGGVCQKCDAVCIHTWENGTCITCGEVCEHTYENGICTTCGAEEPVVLPSVSIAGTFNDWTAAEMTYVDGVSASYTLHLEAKSYTFKIIEDGTWLGNNGTIEDTTTTTSATGWVMESWANDCTLVASKAGTYTFTFNTETNALIVTCEHDPEVVPTITPQSATLSLEDEVLYNIYFTINNLNVDTADMGLLMWNSDPGTADYATAEKITTGVTYDNDQDRYQATSAGIPAKEMGDQKYLCVYAKLADGSYVYSRVFTYSAKRYVTNCLNGDSSDSLKKLCVALMNYGAAAQVYFNYNTDNLMNSDLANAPEIESYSADLLGDVVAADSGKAGAFAATTSGYTKKNATATLEGAFAINFYFTTSQEASDLTMYYWTADAYNAAETLTAENASGKVTMTTTETENRYAGTISGIAAKEMEDTYYVCGVYTVDGETYSTGIVAYSMAKYFKNAAEKATGNTVTLAQAAVVYGYYAKAHFG